PGARLPRAGESMRVDDLAAHCLAHAHVALQASIPQAGSRDGEVLFASRVAPSTEVRLLHGAETDAMLVVVTRRAQATPQLARGRVTHEAPPARGGNGEALLPKRFPRGPIIVQRTQITCGEMLADQRLLVLRLVAAAAFAVPDRLREVRMASWRVALPTADALGRVETLGIMRTHRRCVAVLASFDVHGGPGDGPGRIGARGRPRHQEAARTSEGDRCHE